MALFHGDEAAEKTALAILKRLGATPAAELMRNKMRAEDIRGNPHGPRAAAKRNPAGLTPRELEVLILVTEGLQNMGIATRLFVSPKAIDHQGLSDSGQAQCPAPRGSGGRCLQPRNPTATKGVFQANIGTHPDRLGGRGVTNILVISQVNGYDLDDEVRRLLAPDPRYGARGDFVWLTRERPRRE